MVISDTSCMIYGLPLLYWRRNLGKSGQDLTLNNVLNTIGLWIILWTLETESHTTLGEIALLHNCGVA